MRKLICKKGKVWLDDIQLVIPECLAKKLYYDQIYTINIKSVIEYLNPRAEELPEVHRATAKKYMYLIAKGDKLAEAEKHLEQYHTLVTAHNCVITPKYTGLKIEVVGKHTQIWDTFITSIVNTSTGREMQLPYNKDLGLRNWFKAQATVRKPSPLEILECIRSDGKAANMLFEEWCSDFEYDSDSRKAYALYEKCREIGLRFRSLFPCFNLETYKPLQTHMGIEEVDDAY